MRLNALNNRSNPGINPEPQAKKLSENDLLEEFTRVLKEVVRTVGTATKQDLSDSLLASKELGASIKHRSKEKPVSNLHNQSGNQSEQINTSDKLEHKRSSELKSSTDNDKSENHEEQSLKQLSDEEDTGQLEREKSNQEEQTVSTGEANLELAVEGQQNIIKQDSEQFAEFVAPAENVQQELKPQQDKIELYEEEIELNSDEQSAQDALNQKIDPKLLAKQEVVKTAKPQAEQQTLLTRPEPQIIDGSVSQEVKGQNNQAGDQDQAQLREQIFQRIVESSSAKINNTTLQTAQNRLSPEVLGITLSNSLLEGASSLKDNKSGSVIVANQGARLELGALNRIDGANLRSAGNASDQLSENSKQLKTLSRPLAARTLEQVEKVVREAAKSKDGRSVTLRLDPPELGVLKVDLTLKDGVLYARLAADTAPVQHLLRERAQELQGNLRRLGLNLEGVQVSIVGQDSNDSSWQQNFDRQTANENWSNQSNQVFGLRDEFIRSEIVGVQSEAKLMIKDHWVA